MTRVMVFLSRRSRRDASSNPSAFGGDGCIILYTGPRCKIQTLAEDIKDNIAKCFSANWDRGVKSISSHSVQLWFAVSLQAHACNEMHFPTSFNNTQPCHYFIILYGFAKSLNPLSWIFHKTILALWDLSLVGLIGSRQSSHQQICRANFIAMSI